MSPRTDHSALFAIVLAAGAFPACSSNPTTTPRPEEPVSSAPVLSSSPAPSSAPSQIPNHQAFLDRVIPMVCQRSIRCSPRVHESDRASCLLGPGAKAPSGDPLWMWWRTFGSDRFGALDAELALGRMRFDPTLATSCLADFASRPCSELDSAASCAPMPRADLAPAVEIGGACGVSSSCIEGFCEGEPQGHCARYLAEGGKCTVNQQCGPHHSCGAFGGGMQSGDPQAGHCVRLLHEGESCAQSSVGCDGEQLRCGLTRDGQTRRCMPLPGVGESCIDDRATVRCKPGLFCDANTRSPVCRAPLSLGAACNGGDACAEGTICQGLVESQTMFEDGIGFEVKPGKCTIK